MSSSHHSRDSSVEFQSEQAPATESSIPIQPDSTIQFDEGSNQDDIDRSVGASTPTQSLVSLPVVYATREDPLSTGRAASAESFTRSDAAKNITASPPPRDQRIQYASPSASAPPEAQHGGSPRSDAQSVARTGTEVSVNFFQDDDDDDEEDDGDPPGTNAIETRPDIRRSNESQALGATTTKHESHPSSVIVPPSSVAHSVEQPITTCETSPSTADRQQPHITPAHSPARRVPSDVVLRPAEHAQTWNASTTPTPHHAMYQPSQAQKREEEEFAKNFPFWTKPKGLSACKSSTSADGDTKPSAAAAAAPAGNTIDAPSTRGSSSNLRSKAKEYSDKLRREHRDLSLRLGDSTCSSTPLGGHHQDSSIAFEALDATADNSTGFVAQNTLRKEGAPATDASPEQQQSVKRWLHGVSSDDAIEGGGLSAAKNADYVDDVDLSPRSSDSGDRQPKASKPATVGRPAPVSAVAPAGNFPPPAREQPSPRRGPAASPLRQRTAAQPPVAVPSTPDCCVTVEQLETKRRKLYLIYGQRKGQEYFERFLAEHRLADPNPPAPRRGSTVGSRNATPTPASRRASPSIRRSSPAGGASQQNQEVRETRRSPWDRLYSTRIHHPCHSPTREALRLPSPHERSNSQHGSVHKRHTSPPDEQVFAKLYQTGLEEKARRQQIFLEGKRKKEQRELSEAVEAVILAKILRSTAGHQAMTKSELEAMMAQARQKYMESILSVAKVEGDEQPAKSSQPPSRSGTPVSRTGGRAISRPPTPRLQAHDPLALVHACNLSAEPRLSSDTIDEVTQRLFKPRRRKPADEAKAKEERELAGCTFTPRINNNSLGWTPQRRRSATPTPRSLSVPAATESNDTKPVRSATPDRCKALYTYSQRERQNQEAQRARLIREQKLQILKGKLESDHHFKRRVAVDPSLAERFMASLKS